ncbi:MAG: hypothetical protein OHK0038_04720 [Flammeovirgaceae bacterium]
MIGVEFLGSSSTSYSEMNKYLKMPVQKEYIHRGQIVVSSLYGLIGRKKED